MNKIRHILSLLLIVCIILYNYIFIKFVLHNICLFSIFMVKLNYTIFIWRITSWKTIRELTPLRKSTPFPTPFVASNWTFFSLLRRFLTVWKKILSIWLSRSLRKLSVIIPWEITSEKLIVSFLASLPTWICLR